ncbi:hypothetical protein [Sodalis sp. dw_96]|uniref:hypothetical protein n=1 Tax=Sodalis sp. dw_96 TaxID=2719794 RepID=UPI001BD5F15D|nr:hypothetical protein [Sodalis sp. dw_96]
MWWLILPMLGWACSLFARSVRGRTVSPGLIAPHAPYRVILWSGEEESPVKARFIRENEIIAVTKMALFKLYEKHSLMIVRDESAQVTLTFDVLCRFAEQEQTKKLPALLKDLSVLIPGTAISPVREKQKDELARLKEEISGFIQLRSSLAQVQLRSSPAQVQLRSSPAQVQLRSSPAQGPLYGKNTRTPD